MATCPLSAFGTRWNALNTRERSRPPATKTKPTIIGDSTAAVVAPTPIATSPAVTMGMKMGGTLWHRPRASGRELPSPDAVQSLRYPAVARTNRHDLIDFAILGYRRRDDPHVAVLRV